MNLTVLHPLNACPPPPCLSVDVIIFLMSSLHILLYPFFWLIVNSRLFLHRLSIIILSYSENFHEFHHHMQVLQSSPLIEDSETFIQDNFAYAFINKAMNFL